MLLRVGEGCVEDFGVGDDDCQAAADGIRTMGVVVVF